MALTSANYFARIWRHDCNQIILPTDREKTATRWPCATEKTTKIGFHLKNFRLTTRWRQTQKSYLFIDFQIEFAFKSFRIRISCFGFKLSANQGHMDGQRDGHGSETSLRIKQYPFLEVIASRSPAGLNSSDVIGVVPTVHFSSGLHWLDRSANRGPKNVRFKDRRWYRDVCISLFLFGIPTFLIVILFERNRNFLMTSLYRTELVSRLEADSSPVTRE